MSNPYLLTENRVSKLVKQYEEHKSLVIGVDYDNTLCDLETGEYYKGISDLVLEAQNLGCKLCLWTSNTKRLDVIIDNCKANGLVFDYINKSPIDLGEVTIKPHFNLLLDDSAHLGGAVETLQQVIKEIKQ